MLSIGIDIGSYSIKVAKVKSAYKGYELLHYSEHPLSQDPGKDNKIEIIEILRAIELTAGEDNYQIVAGVHQFEASLRRREFPFRERHKILKSLPFELEDDIPFSSDNAIFDAKITHYRGQTTYVLACACPKEHLMRMLAQFSDGNVHPNIVSIDGVAMANLFEEWREAPWEYPDGLQYLPEAAQTDLIINIGHRTTTAAVIKDGYLLDIRQIDWGGKDIADLIATRYNIHILEALKELRKKAFILINNEGATKEQVALSDLMKQAIDVLTQKLRLALLDMKNLHQIEYRQAILTGGVSQLRNLGPYLTQKIEVASNRLGQLDMLPQLNFGASPNNEISFVTAIGLALEGIKRPKNPPLNLLKEEFAQKNQEVKILWDKWDHTAKILVATFIIILIWSVMRDSFSSSNAEMAYDMMRTQAKKILGSRRPSEKEIKSYISEQEQKLKLKEMVEGLRGIQSSLDILKNISNFAPNKALGGLNVREFKANTQEISIVGEASRAEVVNQLRSELKKIAKSKQVQDIPSPQAITANYKSFGFTFKIERHADGD
ncbi:MAG: hypothetical protein A2Z20_07060 [Bdellovibrionales bacterium RBG_16_40_8]|nr:MAG: hypothetical protein A2Z20_07060 [Bdellovibrionales bacterium RBG_16_40_8]